MKFSTHNSKLINFTCHLSLTTAKRTGSKKTVRKEDDVVMIVLLVHSPVNSKVTCSKKENILLRFDLYLDRSKKNSFRDCEMVLFITAY